jgi:hypothetical protein
MGDLQKRLSIDWTDCPAELQNVVESTQCNVSDGTRSFEGERVEVPTWSYDLSLNPLAFLTGRAEGLTFTHSVNRGRFKSKYRWVSLAG